MMITLNGVPVHWRSSRQPVTALSSAEAEIYALAEAVKCGRLFNWRYEEIYGDGGKVASNDSGGQHTSYYIPERDMCEFEVARNVRHETRVCWGTSE